jgi:hypothetical protein
MWGYVVIRALRAFRRLIFGETKKTVMADNKLDPEGITRKKIYALVDDFLFGLQNGRYQGLISWGDRHMGAVKLMDDMGLIAYRNPQNKITSICDLTIEGLEVIEAGGIENFLENKKL